MEKLIAARKAASEARKFFWETKFLEYETEYCGRSYRDFCKEKSLDYDQLMYWRRRLHPHKKKGNEKNLQDSDKKTVSFIPVEVAAGKISESHSTLEFYYGKHYRFVLPGSIGKTTLVCLFKALEESHVDAAVRN